jgi:hypothetical protein
MLFYLLTNTDMFQSWPLAVFRELISFLACAAYASTYTVWILHMITIIIMKIKCYNM